MYNTIPDYFRKKSMEDIFSTATMQKSWLIWEPEIKKLLGNKFDADQILQLGDHLSDIFKTTGEAGRAQGELSASGIAWESLVCWYINLCCAGSRVVAVKKMSLVPKCIRDAITVNYANFTCNTESDITIIVFPNLSEYNSDIDNLAIKDSQNNQIPNYKKDKFNSEISEFLAKRDFNHFELGIIQCKTNWNDNAQIPMLWDMIYSVGGFKNNHISIGKNGFSIQNIEKFTYSFVTVPSNINVKYHANSVATKRVTNLSGGNYWGKASQQGVAKSLKEIFTNNFSNGVRNNSLRIDLKEAIPFFALGEPLNYLNI